jgi:citrate synthase
MATNHSFISAAEAARRLGVSRATLYSYVSRGFVRSESVPGSTRSRRYSGEDVERLRSRSEQRRDPAKAAGQALHWGLPILESSITLIADGALYFRGHDAATLARERSLEEVVSLIWTGSFDSDIFSTPLHVVAGGESLERLSFVTRAQSMLPIVATRDTLAYDLRPKPVAQTGWRIVNLLTSVAAESPELEETIEETLCKHWRIRGKSAPDLIRAALILSADHELNVSSFTARCVASAGSSPYAVVLAGLAAIEGTKHGGVTPRVEALFDDLARARGVAAALASRLRRGETLDGFGHRLYPSGDPRAKVIFDMLAEHHPKSKELAFARTVATEGERLLGEAPNLDLALVALTRTLHLPDGAALTLFALGRTIGWIAHAIEQYQLDAIIRPRAKYVGEMP